jgi:hypothetical protein
MYGRNDAPVADTPNGLAFAASATSDKPVTRYNVEDYLKLLGRKPVTCGDARAKRVL